MGPFFLRDYDNNHLHESQLVYHAFMEGHCISRLFVMSVFLSLNITTLYISDPPKYDNATDNPVYASYAWEQHIPKKSLVLSMKNWTLISVGTLFI